MASRLGQSAILLGHRWKAVPAWKRAGTRCSGGIGDRSGAVARRSIPVTGSTAILGRFAPESSGSAPECRWGWVDILLPAAGQQPGLGCSSGWRFVEQPGLGYAELTGVARQGRLTGGDRSAPVARTGRCPGGQLPRVPAAGWTTGRHLVGPGRLVSGSAGQDGVLLTVLRLTLLDGQLHDPSRWRQGMNRARHPDRLRPAIGTG